MNCTVDKAMNMTEIEENLHRIPNWDADWGGNLYGKYHLLKEIKTKSWRESMHVLSIIDELAEKENHHPDIELGWGYINVKLKTHSAEGVTETDFVMAEKIEDIL